MRANVLRICSPVLAALCVLNAFAIAQTPATPAEAKTVAETPESVFLAPPFRVGDHLAITLTNRRHQSGKDTRPIDARYVTPVDLEVIEVGTEGYVLAWTVHRPQVDGLALNDNPTLDRLIEITAGLRFELMLDREMNYRGLRNWEAVAENSMKVIDVLEPKGTENEAARTKLRELVSNRQMVEAVMAKHPTLYLFPFGFELVVGQPRTFNAELPNPLGGDPLPAQLTATLVRSHPDGPLEFRCTQIPDAEGTRRMINMLMERLAPPGNAIPLDQLPQMDIRDEATFTIDPANGYVRSMSHRRMIKMMEGERTDEFSIEVTKIDRR